MPIKYEYTVTAEYARTKWTVVTGTYESAIRAARAIVKTSPEVGIAVVTDRKGELKKIVKTSD